MFFVQKRKVKWNSRFQNIALTTTDQASVSDRCILLIVLRIWVSGKWNSTMLSWFLENQRKILFFFLKHLDSVASMAFICGLQFLFLVFHWMKGAWGRGVWPQPFVLRQWWDPKQCDYLCWKSVASLMGNFTLLKYDLVRNHLYFS